MSNLGTCHRCPYRQQTCAGPCPCLADDAGRDIQDRAAAGDCPMDYFDAPERMPARAPAAAPSQPQPGVQTFEGAAMWAELHARPRGAEDLASEGEWMEAFTRRLPCGACRAHWRELLAATPPDLASRERYFAWTVNAHNAVNHRLGKPEMPMAEARQLHRWRTEADDRTPVEARSIDN